jgi:hypothetical protein
MLKNHFSSDPSDFLTLKESIHTRIRITKLMINFKSSIVYGFGVLKVSVLYRLTCLRIFKAKINRGLSNNKKCHNHYNLLAFMCL